MSEEKKVKWLHEFEVNKTVKKEVSEDGKDESGEPIKITKQIEEKVPVKFCLKRPNRRLYEDADLFYGVRLSEGIKEGLLTKTLLAKRFSNDGGTMSESEKDDYSVAYEKLTTIENKIQRTQINLEKIPEEEKTEKLRELIKNGIAASCFMNLLLKLDRELLYKNIHAYSSAWSISLYSLGEKNFSFS